MIQDGYGSFGAHAAVYGVARQAFPEDVFTYLISRAGGRTTVLDTGCGTGIPSRQLNNHGFTVTGSDSDKRMIEQAVIDSNGYAIEYIAAPSNHLPFQDGQFDIVTAFSAFHWFCDNDSLSEIRRVINDRGLLLIVNKNEMGSMKKLIKSTLIPFLAGALPTDVKQVYNPADVLIAHDYTEVQEYVVPVVEEYSIDDAVLYAQSMSVWNLVTDQNRTQAREALSKAFRMNAQQGVVVRPLEVKVVSGYVSGKRN